MTPRLIPALLIAGVALLFPKVGYASTFSYSSGTLAATASFDIVGGDLVVTLTNTSTGDPRVPTDILTGVFFDVGGDPTLDPLSAKICASCTVTYGGGTDPGNSVGGEWAYRQATDLAYGANYGISSTGLGLFGPGDIFGGTNLSGPVEPDGLQYGITTKNTDTPGNDNGGLAGTPLITYQVIFTLALPSNVSALDVSNVTFQYGTALNEVTVPEPATMTLLGTGLLGLVFARRRREIES